MDVSYVYDKTVEDTGHFLVDTSLYLFSYWEEPTV
jgi:hypothetical protein